MTSEPNKVRVETVGYKRAIGWMAEGVLWSTVGFVGGVVLLAALVALEAVR